MKGIILAAGSGTRVYPMTIAVSKQLMPVYDKADDLLSADNPNACRHSRDPHYSHAHEAAAFRQLLDDGSQWGLSLVYAVQADPKGLAQAFTIGADFVAVGPSCLVLGDNIFFGHGLSESCFRLGRGQSALRFLAIR